MKRLEILFTDQKAATTVWILIDILLINIACILAYWIRYDLQLFRAVDPAFDVPYRVYLPFVAIFTLLLVWVYRQHGIYRLRHQISWFDEFYAIVNGTTTGIVIIIVFIFIYQPTFYSRAIFIYAGCLAMAILSLSRLLKVMLLRQMRRQGVGVKQVLIIGAGEIARTVMRAIVANRDLGFNIIGFLDDHPTRGETDIGRFKALGGVDKLADILSSWPVEEVIITLPWQYHRKILSIMAQCERKNVRVRIVPDLFQITLNHMQVDEIAGVPMIGIKEVGISGLSQFLKRMIDMVFSALVLVISAPLMALIALMIKMDSPGPVFFSQERVGKMGQRFTLYKFRSMVENAEEQRQALEALNEADGPLFKIKQDPRATRLGRQLRRLSLDELPQFYNVLCGEMSLIGPRPAIPAEVEQYQEWQKRRLEVSPGITGMWQVSGRSDLTFDEMALLDIYYIENWSPALDAKIFLQTIPRVIFGNGAY
ncbi:MAG: undecaprenyl-phosphate glucose phosphotransferase [Anaerolineae bacterium]|nr:undecaprenyl-phosphate glucose phosphotransferase [Anaerolineae bacterium]